MILVLTPTLPLLQCLLGPSYSPVTLLCLGSRDSASHLFMRLSTSLYLNPCICSKKHSICFTNTFPAMPNFHKSAEIISLLKPILNLCVYTWGWQSSLHDNQICMYQGSSCLYLCQAYQAIWISRLFSLLLSDHPAAGISSVLLIFLFPMDNQQSLWSRTSTAQLPTDLDCVVSLQLWWKLFFFLAQASTRFLIPVNSLAMHMLTPLHFSNQSSFFVSLPTLMLTSRNPTEIIFEIGFLPIYLKISMSRCGKYKRKPCFL